MKNALILHGLDFYKAGNQHLTNWFPWLKEELEKLGYDVWLPELPDAWEPDINKYWDFLKDFNFNNETIIVGHSAGGTAVFGILNKLPANKKIKLAISVAGLYMDNNGRCKKLFSEKYDWMKIGKQAEKICIMWSEDDPYITRFHTDNLSAKLGVEPIIFKDKKHFDLGASEEFRKFPELLEMIKKEE